MADVQFFQVTSFPGSPEPDSWYVLKRSANRADLRITDSAGVYYDVDTDAKMLASIIAGLNIVNGAIIDGDTILAALGKSQGQINAINTSIGTINTSLADKVDKVTGKGLSANDYSNTEKDKVANSKTVTDLITVVAPAVDLNDMEQKANSALQSINSIPAGGDLSGTYPNPAVLNSAVLAKVLTGLNVTGGSLAATDSLLQAFGKLQNQLNSVLGGAIYQGVWNATTNSPTLSDGTGTKGHYYVVSVAGTRNLGSGNIDFQIGDWAIHNGTAYEKVDNTDAVSSVNGFTGAVNLTTANISEVTNLYFTNARAIASVLTGYTSGAGTVAATDTILQAIQKLNGNIAAIIQATNANLATIHHAANQKSSIVDADEVTGGDSAASFGLIRTTWTDIKAFLKTYFDTLYQDLSSNQTISGIKTYLNGKFGFRNVANTFTSFFTNSNAAARTYTFQDKDGTLADLADLLNYILKNGAAGGQTLIGGTASGDDLTLKSTSDSTKGSIILDDLFTYSGGKLSIKNASAATNTLLELLTTGDDPIFTIVLTDGEVVRFVIGGSNGGNYMYFDSGQREIGVKVDFNSQWNAYFKGWHPTFGKPLVVRSWDTQVSNLIEVIEDFGSNNVIFNVGPLGDAYVRDLKLMKGICGSFSGAGTATTTFTVTFGGTQPNTTYQVAITPTAALSAALFYVTNKTSTTFDVVYLAGLTGTVTFDWELHQND